MPLELHVHLVGRGDLTGEIYRQLRAAIVEGRLRAGERLPPTRELATGLAVSRTTVMEAYDRLLSEGFTEARTGSGTYVSDAVDGTPPQTAAPPGALRPRPFWDGVWLPRALDSALDYDFRTGIPDTRLFPFDHWRRLEGRAWRRAAKGGTPAYGEPAGDPDLRAAIVRHLAVARGVRAGADDVVITNGTQQGVDVIARALLRPGDVVAVEDPGYAPPRHLFSSLGLTVVGVEVDDEGLRVDDLPGDAKLVFVAPSHQFPLGIAMSLRRRTQLLAWAERHDAAILEDDYDSEFRLTARPIEPLQALDRTGRVLYVGTFSKTLLPALRIGFVIVPASIRRAVATAKFLTDWHTSMPIQRTLAAFLDDGSFARHVRRLRVIYRERHEVLTATLRRDFADDLDVLPASAGVHVAALSRRHGVDALSRIAGRAAADGVTVQEVAALAVAERRRAGLLFGYGAITVERIPEGLARLRAAFDAEVAPGTLST